MVQELCCPAVVAALKLELGKIVQSIDLGWTNLILVL